MDGLRPYLIILNAAESRHRHFSFLIPHLLNRFGLFAGAPICNLHNFTLKKYI